MPLAIFDLDETLISGDSDHAWGQFMVERGLVDGELYGRENDRFYADYKAGRLDVMAYLKFVLRPLAGMTLGELAPLQQAFLLAKIEPMIPSKALDLLQWHREHGDTLVMITATNDLITAPIAKRLGVGTLIASKAEILGGRVTGAVEGIPSFREGKVRRLEAYLEQTQAPLQGSCFYSDSINDVPLLEFVERPVAVDPDPELKKTALARGWEIISLR
jgi:HAD superfamily hydrolase (TIGR01490 family)